MFYKPVSLGSTTFSIIDGTSLKSGSELNDSSLSSLEYPNLMHVEYHSIFSISW